MIQSNVLIPEYFVTHEPERGNDKASLVLFLCAKNRTAIDPSGGIPATIGSSTGVVARSLPIFTEISFHPISRYLYYPKEKILENQRT